MRYLQRDSELSLAGVNPEVMATQKLFKSDAMRVADRSTD